jgi:putative DNA primase/helicase
MIDANRIAAALGGAKPNGRGWLARCPCHFDDDPSLSLADAGDRLLVWCFAGCSSLDVLAELRRRGLLDRHERQRPSTTAERDKRVNAALGRRRAENRRKAEDAAKRTAEAAELWERTEPAGRVVANYLAGRGITVRTPEALRWMPDASAIVARVDDVRGRLVAVHRTFLYLTGNGWRRRNRMMLGPCAGGAVRLAPAAETLMIGEGVETVMAAMQCAGMPGWAALSTSGLKALKLPHSVRRVVILADHDADGAGERAADEAARRWLREGRQVRVAMPAEPGSDFNDVLKRGVRAEVRDGR